MGLDTVELVMELEEEFGVPLTDEVAAEMATPRDVIEYLDGKLSESGSGCLSQQCFYALRNVFVAQGLCERSAFQLDEGLQGLIPLQRRRGVWEAIQSKLGCHLPTLQFSLWVKLLWWISPALLCSVFYFIGGLSFKLSFLLACLLGYSLFCLFAHFSSAAVHFPKGLNTPREVVVWVCGKWPNLMGNRSASLSRVEIEEKVRNITLRYCDPEDYAEDAQFIRDLGLD